MFMVHEEWLHILTTDDRVSIEGANKDGDVEIRTVGQLAQQSSTTTQYIIAQVICGMYVSDNNINSTITGHTRTTLQQLCNILETLLYKNNFKYQSVYPALFR